MPPAAAKPRYALMRTGDEIFPAMLEAIEAARESVCFEMYIYEASPIGERFRGALVQARKRGLRVRVLIDSFGSVTLPGNFWDPLKAAGGEVRMFNPLAIRFFGIRNHRKLLVCDGQVAFVGGFNVAPEYEGDGVQKGWCDLGVRLEGPLVPRLVDSFEEMFARAEFKHKRFPLFRKLSAKRMVSSGGEQLLFSGPGRGPNPIKRSLRKDLKSGRDVAIMVAYFLPTWRLRRQLAQVARRGGRVRLIVPGKSDVALSQFAGRSLYRRLLNAGLAIFEYQPQVLHAKMVIIDDIVYLGSANLDQRSLHINYELLVRIEDQALAASARETFEKALAQSEAITPEGWRKSRSFWRRMKHRWAYFVLVHLDPWIARRQWRRLPD